MRFYNFCCIDDLENVYLQVHCVCVVFLMNVLLGEGFVGSLYNDVSILRRLTFGGGVCRVWKVAVTSLTSRGE